MRNSLVDNIGNEELMSKIVHSLEDAINQLLLAKAQHN